jgi:hypothetical protein
MGKLISWIIGKCRLQKVFTLETKYVINGKEVSEAVWYANGGKEMEEELEHLEKMLREMKMK